MKKVAIIGSGLGGLSTAIRLATDGFDVYIFEKNSTIGGKANEIRTGGFRFDAGPSILTMPFILEDLFNYANEKIASYLTLERMHITCKYFFSDGTIINAFSNPNKFAEEIEKKTSDSFESVNNFLAYSKKIYELTSDLFLFNSIKDPKSIFTFKSLKTLLHLSKIDPFRTMHESVSRFFKDKRTIQLFDRFATYNGSNPYLAPATLNIISHVELNLGVSLPQNGIRAIPLALESLAKQKGVNIILNSEVEKIIIKENQTHGIMVNGINLPFDIVVVNSDINFAYSKLLKEINEKSKNSLLKLEPSSSAVVFYWGIRGIHSSLETHNILFSQDYKKEFDELFNLNKCASDPTVYIYISSKYNRNDALNECENWFVMVNAPYNNGQNWDEEIKKTKSAVIQKVNSILNIDLADKIISENILSPPDIERTTNSQFGSIYGISSNSRKAAFLRHDNKSTKYKNLYFCGGSVHPGGGIPLVLLSGKIVSDLIKRDSC